MESFLSMKYKNHPVEIVIVTVSIKFEKIVCGSVLNNNIISNEGPSINRNYFCLSRYWNFFTLNSALNLYSSERRCSRKVCKKYKSEVVSCMKLSFDL